MSVGGVGFQLTAYVIGSERGYILREAAADRVVKVLRLLHDFPQGPDRVRKIGYRGFFYHFLGIDGLRKQNFDFKATRDIDESLNTVELSVIDTALVLCGVVTAQQYFSGRGKVETEIRKLADEIYGRVDWPFMLDKGTNQFYLGWKPKEKRDDESGRFGRFLLEDQERLGHYSSKHADGKELPATLDYYTDEGVLIALLAIASPNPKHRVNPDTFFSMIRQGKPFIKTFPGSLFTYQFGSVWLDTRALGRDKDPAGKAPSVDYFENTRRAIQACRQYAVKNPERRTSLGDLRWGLSACDGPFHDYGAEAAPPLALAKMGGCIGGKGKFVERPLELGTLTVYGAACCIVHEPADTVAALWECQRLGLLHPRFGFADAYNLEIADAVTNCIDAHDPGVLRRKGPWANHCGFSIDHGPMLVLIDNYLEGQFTPKLFMSHPSIRQALKQLFPDAKLD
jgi:hypothetical protein